MSFAYSPSKIADNGSKQPAAVVCGCTATLCDVKKGQFPYFYTHLDTEKQQKKHNFPNIREVYWQQAEIIIQIFCWQVQGFVRPYGIRNLHLKSFAPPSLLICLFLRPLPAGTESFVGGTSAIYHAAPSEFKWSFLSSRSPLVYLWRYPVLEIQFRQQCESAEVIAVRRVLFQLPFRWHNQSSSQHSDFPKIRQSRGHFWEIPARHVCALQGICVRGSTREEWNNKNRHSVAAPPRPQAPPPPLPPLSALPRSRSSRKCLKQTQSCDCFDSSSRWFPMEQVSLLSRLLPHTLPGNDPSPQGVTFKGIHPVWLQPLFPQSANLLSVSAADFDCYQRFLWDLVLWVDSNLPVSRYRLL